MSKNDGGPAFPCERGHIPDGTWNQTFEPGMTIRDYFAAKAMQGILAGDHPITHGENPLVMVAGVAYDMADAMIKAREL